MSYWGFNNKQGIEGRHADGKSRIFQSSMVAHTWANQSVDCGRNGKGSMYFKGRTIYSYGEHWPLATITDRRSANGHIIVVVNNTHAATEGRGWGNSTNRHLRYVQGALRGHPDYECVAGDVDSTKLAITDPIAAFNMIAARKLFDMHAHKIELCNMRKKVWFGYTEVSPEDRVGALDDTSLIGFCNTVMIALPVYDLAAMRAEIQTAVDDYVIGEPKREKDRAARAKRACLDKLAKWHKQQQSGYVPYRSRIDVKDAFEALTLAMQHYPAARWENYRVELQTRIALAEMDGNFDKLNPEAGNIRYERRYGRRPTVTISDWLKGNGSTSMLDGRWSMRSTLMRKRNERLETTAGVEVPWQHAVRCFLIAVDCYNGKEGYTPKGELRIGHFTLNAIDENGTLHAGCHHLKFKDMLALACQETPDLVQHVEPRYPVPAVI